MEIPAEIKKMYLYGFQKKKYNLRNARNKVVSESLKHIKKLVFNNIVVHSAI